MNTETALKEAGRKARRNGARPRKDERLQRCYEIVERAANNDCACPTNAQLADMLGYSGIGHPSGLLSLLEAMGFITVERSNHGRVVTICKTGRRTAGIITPRKEGDWTEDQDAILMDGIAEGESFSAVGVIIGKTKSACVSRFRKISAAMGEQAR